MNKFILKPFYFLRHGETDWNKNGIYMGSKDVPLNDLGIAQAMDVGKLLKNEYISTIVTSPLIRARKTANIITKSTNSSIVELKELQEACWGEKEGESKYNNLFLDSWIDGNEIKNAEKYTDFVIRVRLGLEKALKYPSPVLIVSHGIVYWAIQEILGLTFIDIGNCEVIFHTPPENENNPWNILNLSNKNNFYEWQ